ncbi:MULTISPECIES: T9SS type A sorting domain-containing protein [Flavobacterium]|uniref:Ig-like domain-containing protein n=1 Tax=Flavobacterium TaxID=237 RepID=UPI001FCA609E|nr:MULTISPECIES: T9SS type A sorting domain-containing protein [Flavobacterium]UOK42308.1 T9SS type A sorting domain-containing protein [Flavobacterium enshiense]
MQKKLRLGKVFDYFGLKKENRLLHGTVVALSLFCFSNNSFAQQTTIINPAAEGGFNSGNTFAANGWTVANEGTGPIKWAVGTAASGTTSVGAITNGSTDVTLTAANANILQGMIVYGDNIPANTFVASIAGTTLTLSQNATATLGTVTLGFGKTSGGGISVATSQMTTASIAANTYSITLAAANPNISVGMLIAPVAGFIGADTYVASINGTALGLSKASINSAAFATAQTLSFSATGSGISGNAAYVTNDNGVTNSYGGYSGNRTVYFYRDITNVPSIQNAMTLTFDVKSAPTFGAGWQVWVAPITQPVAGTNTQVTGPMAYGVSWPGATLISFNSATQVATTKNTAFIPKSFAGTPFRLIFVWTNGTTAGTVPPAAIDNISLVSRVPEEINCAHSGLWSQPGTWEGGNVPTPADTAVLNDDGEVVMIDSRYSGADALFLSGTNTLVQFATSNIMDEFTVARDLTLSAGGSRFNNHDGANGKYLKLGRNLNVGTTARFDSSVGGSTALQGRLTLNGSTLQTITVATGGFVGGSAAGVNTFSNVDGVLNQLEVTNTSTATPNVVWNADGVRLRTSITLTSGRISVSSGKRFVIGNFGSISSNNMNIAPGSGFISGTVSRFMSSGSTKLVQPGTEYPGTDNNAKAFWYPFINGTSGSDRSVYFLADANPATNGEVAITYTNANTVTGSLSVADGGYTINKRYDGNWAFSTPNSNAVPSGPALIYVPNATTPTNRVGIYANGAYEAIDGTSRLMYLTTAMPGTHQDGTAQPFIFRNGLTVADLTTAPLYVGVSNASSLDTATGITSLTSGNWNSTSTWVGGVVPTCSNVVTIASGHNVTVSATANAAGVIIAKGGTLTNNAGTSTMTVGNCANNLNNAAFINNGTHAMIAGNLKVNGFVAHKNGSFFNQTGGDIVIDSNDNGNPATSVAFGGASCKIETSNLDLTGGKITIVDPLVNIGTPITGTSISSFNVNTAGAAGTFSVNGTIGAATLNTINITGTYNIFEAGQVVSGHANIVPGTKIQTVSVGGVGSPPAITLTLDRPATGAIAAGTPISYSSMANGLFGVVIEPSAANANLSVGQSVSGTGIPVGAKITALAFNGLGTNFVGKVTLSAAVSDLGTSPITAQQPITIAGVNPGASTVTLTAVNPNIVAGMNVSGSGIKPGTFLTDVTGAKLTLSEPIQAGAPSPLVMDFHVSNAQSSGSFIYASPNNYATGLNHTLQIGDGVSTHSSSLMTNGFNCQFQAAGGLFSLGNLIVNNAPNGADRFMNVSSNNVNNQYNMNVQNAFTVTAGSVFKKTFSNATVYVGGNIVNNGTINFPSGSTLLYLGNFINGVAVPTALPQTISGSGVFATNQWALTPGITNGSFPSLQVNNTSAQGVTISVPNFRLLSGVILTNGIVHTSAAYPIYVGNPDVTASTPTSGTFSGGSATSYIDGPAVHANMSSATMTQSKLFPLGKNGKYLPILIASTGGVELMAEAFDTNSGTVNATNVSNLSANRWKVTRVGSAGTFTGYNVRLASSSPVVTASNIIVHSATENGTYDIVSTPASATTFDAAHFSIPAFPSIVLATNQTGGFLGNFAYAEGPACTGTPTPGATVASSSSVCAGQSVTLSLTTPTTGALVTYQWQSSVNAGPMTNIAGATAATYVATPTANTSYQCIVTCSGSSGTSTPVAVTTVASSVTVTGTSMCTGGTANLSAAGSAILNWYDAPTGGNLVNEGTNFTPTVSQTTTYYVASGSVSSNGSANTAAFGGTAASSAVYKGISFDAVNTFELKTVTVYPKNTASLTPITVGLFDANGNVVSGTNQVTFTPTLNTGTMGSVSQVVTLNYTIPVGKDYRLVVTNGLVAANNTLGNSTGVIDYPSTNGPIRLTGNVSGLNDAIVVTDNTTNVFHNLTYEEVCEALRVPVTATVVNTQAPTAAATQDACATKTIADFIVNGGSATASGLTWYADSALGFTIPTTTPAVLGTTYYVSQTISGCEGPRTGITAGGTCLSTEDFKIAELKYFPNPVNDQLTITAKDVITRIEVYNLLGQQLKALDTTTNNVQMNFGGFASSTYLVKVYSEDHVDFFKVIKR